MAESFIERNSWVPGVVAAFVLFIVGTGVTLFLRHRDKDSKHLDYRVISDTPIFSGSDRPNHLKVTYFDEPITDPRVTYIRVKNTGKQVIRPADVLTKFSISREQAKLLDAKMVNASAENLAQLNRNSTTNQLELELETLNARDWFELRPIYDGGKAQRLSVIGRLDGETRPPTVYRDRDKKTILSSVFSSLAAMGLGAGIVVGVYYATGAQHGNNTILAILTTLGFCIGIASIATLLVKIERK